MENLKAQRWPFVESPGEFTDRLIAARNNSITMLAAVRTVLIEDPPTIAKEYLEMASGLGYCRMHNACFCAKNLCAEDTAEVHASCPNWKVGERENG